LAWYVEEEDSIGLQRMPTSNYAFCEENTEREGDERMVGNMNAQDEQTVLHETEQQKRTRKIIVVLFFLAVLSVVTYILLQLFVERMP